MPQEDGVAHSYWHGSIKVRKGDSLNFIILSGFLIFLLHTSKIKAQYPLVCLCVMVLLIEGLSWKYAIKIDYDGHAS